MYIVKSPIFFKKKCILNDIVPPGCLLIYLRYGIFT